MPHTTTGRCVSWLRRARLVATVSLLGAAVAMPTGTPAHAAGHTVEMNMTVQPSANAGYNYNGYGKGAMTVTIPAGWQVIVHFANNGDLAHSLIVLPFTPTPPAVPAATPVFPGAVTKDAQAGLPVKSTATVTFTASKSGTYEFVCGVPAHAVLGMWDRLEISASAAQPSVTPATAAAAIAFKVH